MKNNVAQELYNLIHSLSPSEKSYFKKGLTKRSDGKLGDIFEIFNKRSLFEDGPIRDELKRSYSNPTDACSKLIQAILKAMVNYHANSNTNSELNLLLSEIEFAYSKKQILISERLINKGLQLAKNNNLHTYIYQFWMWKTRLPVLGYNAHKNLYENALEEMKQAAALQQGFAQLIAMQRAMERFAKWKPLSREGHQDLLDILNSETTDQTSYTGPGSEVLNLQTKSLKAGINFEFGNWEASYEILSNHVDSLGNAETLPDRQFRNWLANMNNLMGLCALLYNKNEYLKRRKQLMEAIKSRKLDAQPQVSANLAFNDITHKMFDGSHKEAIEDLQNLVKQGQESVLSANYDKATALCALSIARFMQGNYKGFIADCNEILADKECQKNRIIVHTTKWVELLAVYLLDYASLFSNKALSMKRYLKKLNSGFSWEAKIIKTLQNTFDLEDKERRNAFKSLHLQLKDHQFELRSAIRDFDMLLWVEAMSLGKSLGELTTERYKTS